MARNRNYDSSDSYANSRRSRISSRDFDDYIPSARGSRITEPDDYDYEEPYENEYEDGYGTYSDYPDNEGYDYDYEDEGYDDLDSGYTETDDTDLEYADADREYRRQTRDYSARRSNAPSSLDLSANNSAPRGRFQTQNSSDAEKYLNYLERYDRGEIDNHDMSRIQRRFANKPFWKTFRPSKDLIEKYGSGNDSTRWPMFRREGSQWKPVFWRND